MAKFKHKIDLLTRTDTDDETLAKLNQIVNVYEHNEEDFIRNFDMIIKHYRDHLGHGSKIIHGLGQMVEFRMYKGQEPIGLSLFKFALNYIMNMPMILLNVDMKKWVPWTPAKFTNSGWVNEMNNIIVACRGKCTSYQMCEYLEWIKFELNQLVTQVGDILAYSISNNEFIELMNREPEARESMTCTFDIPKNTTPDKLEKIISARIMRLLDLMTMHTDLSCSVYAQNGLFNPGQAKEFFVHMGHKPDLLGNTIPYSAKTNILMGTKDIRAHVVDARGGLKAELLKDKVSDAGTFERSLSTLMSGVRWVDMNYNCDSQHFRIKRITSMDDIQNLDGRVATLDKQRYFIIDPRDPKQDLIGKIIYMKTPITCCHPNRHKGVICSACYGKLLASINQDVHIGRVSALNCADEMEQKLLSAKHALNTKTSEIQFTSNFDDYFVHDYCVIGLSPAIISSVMQTTDSDSLYLEIHPNSVTKHLDGENRNFDKSVDEIVVYNSKTKTREIIKELKGLKLYLYPTLNEEFYYKPSIQHPNDPVRISFRDLVESDCAGQLFEYQFKNSEIADPLLKLNHILNNGKNINAYGTYNECLDSIMPLFKAGGIHIPDIHIEILVGCLVHTSDMGTVDWTKINPEYKFFSVDTSIRYSDSVVTSLLYDHSNQQIAGMFGTYNKTGTSIYDVYLTE